MTDIKAIRNAEPVEQTLSRMIESEGVNILVDENCTEETRLNILAAAELYLRNRDRNISVRFIGMRNSSALLKKSAAYYGLDDHCEVIGTDDMSEILTWFLGCSALVTEDRNSAGSEFAAELHETRILPLSGAGEKLENGVFTVDCTPESLCAVFMQIGEGKYRTELTGHCWMA